MCELSLEKGEERVVADLTGRAGELSFNTLATDGEFLYFSWQEEEGDLWLMDVVMDDSE